MAYLDTSLLGAYYCSEALSNQVNEALFSLADRIISPLVEVELCSLVAMKVRTASLTREGAIRTLALFRQHRSEGLYQMVELGSHEYEIASTWISRLETSLRTLDALHLACAFTHGQSLWTSDKPLATAAKYLGIDHQLFH